MKALLARLIKEASLQTGVYRHTFFNVYPYMFSPAQLIFLTDCLRKAADVPGCCVEAGCAQGATTVFLRKFMDDEGIRKDYISIDTFSGFTTEHTDYEVEQRGKPRAAMTPSRQSDGSAPSRPGVRQNIGDFGSNKKSWYDYTIHLEGVGGVRSVEMDVTKFDFKSIAPIAFCLLDVDLYLPVRDALPKIYDVLSPNGIIVVDDCREGGAYDGALEAYRDFVGANHLTEDIRLGKLGLITKRRQ
jgi:hypothetical protein